MDDLLCAYSKPFILTCSLYLSLLAGYAVQKFGFKSVVLVGGAFIFVGFLYMWLAILQVLPSNIQSICFFYFLSQAGVCCHISSAVTVSVKLFPPEARGAGNAAAYSMYVYIDWFSFWNYYYLISIRMSLLLLLPLLLLLLHATTTTNSNPVTLEPI